MASTPGGVDAVVVGAGLMGRWHAYEIRRVGGRVTAVVDPDLDRARALARRSGGARTGKTMGGVLAEAGPSVVHVCTPSGTHEPLIEEALAAGCHVLVEKPLARNGSETERLLDDAEEQGLLLAPVHQFGFQPGVRRLHRAADRLGSIRHLMGEARSAGAEGRSDAEAERVAAEILPHFLSLAHRFLPGGLATAEWHAFRPRPGELSVEGMKDGIGLHFLVSMGGRPPTNRWTVIGSRGTGRADLYHGYGLIEPGDTSRAWKVARPFVLRGIGLSKATANLLGRSARRQPAYPGLRELIGAFHGAVRAGTANPVPAEESRQVARTLDRIIDRGP